MWNCGGLGLSRRCGVSADSKKYWSFGTYWHCTRMLKDDELIQHILAVVLRCVHLYLGCQFLNFVTDMCFLLLYDSLKASEDGVKSFFGDVYELYTKASLNPFYDPDQKITVSSRYFDSKATQLAKYHQITPL